MLSESIIEIYLNDVPPDVFAAIITFIYQDDALVRLYGCHNCIFSVIGKRFLIGHFRVVLNLITNAGLSAKLFI